MAGSITFAIGDIHGCLAKLTALLKICGEIAAERRSRFVFIGDYVDRGPHSREVLDLLTGKQKAESDRFICLRGNHEEMLLRASDRNRSDSDLMTWCGNGGERTLESYGADDPRDLPKDHLAWLASLPLTFSDGKRLYVHAGIRPGVPIAQQSQHDLLWIREPFLSSDAVRPEFVVHGHTPTRSRRPELRPNRLNVDTAACLDGQLTAAMFTGSSVCPIAFADSSGAVVQVGAATNEDSSGEQ